MIPVLVIAEIGSVHDGSFGNACKLVELAKSVGADAVKFQTHLAEAESLPNAPSPAYFSSESRMDYFRRTGFSAEQWGKLRAHAEKTGITFVSSPFSLEAVDLLESVGLAFYKVPSGEVTNVPLLERIAQTGKPCVVSSGMNSWGELDAAVGVLRQGGPLTVMQCSSVYPCPPERVGLNVLVEMKGRYGLPVGLSDHTRGLAAAVAAVTLGATMVEKHLTFSRAMYGSDAAHSMEPGEFQQMVGAIRETSAMLAATVDKNDVARFQDMKLIFEKSLVSAVPLSRGQTLRREDLTFKKPGDGIKAADYQRWVGRTMARDIPANQKLLPEDFV
jgi:N,N'-diacetyllegionaminate synthase